MMPVTRPTKAVAAGLSSTLLGVILLLPVLSTSQRLEHTEHSLGRGSSGGVDSLDDSLLLNTLLQKPTSPPSSAVSVEERAEHEHGSPAEIVARNAKHTTTNPTIDNFFSTESAIVTLAPAGLKAVIGKAAAADYDDDRRAAVRAPPARPASPSAGLSSPGQTRSLQDWEVADFVLLATVDGKIHARDRTTGEPRWALEADSPVVETVYHRKNNETGRARERRARTRTAEDGENDLLWIVEPSQDGNLYVYSTGPNFGMQKVGLTVKQLVEELSPYAGEDPPVVYTGEKKNTLYTIDAATGRILKMFSSSGSTVMDEGSCRRVSGLETLDEDECDSVGTLTLGRTEYTVGIQNQATGEPICTIKFFEWSPNNRDKDLHSQYVSTLDNKYVYSKFDGTVFVLDYSRAGAAGASSAALKAPQRPVYRQKFSSPVIRVYDVARPYDADSRDPSLIILPQPVGPAFVEPEESPTVFVNTTDSGSWYALSESSYPAVTDGASQATCYTSNWLEQNFASQSFFSSPAPELVGVHPLSHDFKRRGTIPTISGPEEMVSVPREALDNYTEKQLAYPPPDGKTASLPSLLASDTVKLPIILLILAVALWSWWKNAPALDSQRTLKNIKVARITVPNVNRDLISPEDVPLPDDIDDFQSDVGESTADLWHQSQGAGGSISLGSDTGYASSLGDSGLLVNDDKVEEMRGTAEEVSTGAETPKPRKRAHRGQRGGRKRKKSQNPPGSQQESKDDTILGVDQIVERLKHIGESPGLQPDQITARGTDITDVSGEIELNSLRIYTDKILGAGSGGTFVFEGKFEGRLVAVKRMLPQYFELASQEVSLLQQSDDHANVIRYFCQQRDANFLYIAVELCQASLWDLYQTEELLLDDRTALVTEINQDVPRALHQIASGLAHLHGLRIIHRDIKPQNILVAYPRKNQVAGPRFVISDFGLCKTLPDNASTLIGTTGNAGTVGWKAPELINVPTGSDGRANLNGLSDSRDSSSSSDQGSTSTGVKRAVDIFSLGCVFYYVLTGGSHPFDDAEGWVQLRELNVKKGKANFSALTGLGDDAEEPIHLLSQMLAHRPEARPSARQVLHHPFFWSADRRLAFLCDVSDHWERELRDPPSPALDVLESFAADAIGAKNDFLAILDRRFVDALGRQRKYVGSRLLDLLRALRNKRNHYEDLPPDMQTRVGPLPAGYLRYWTSRFPKLLMACYQAVEACELDSEPRFKHYFQPAE